MQRFVVREQRSGKMEFLGVAPASSPIQAIETVRRYAMRDEAVRMTASVLKVTRK